MKFSEMPYSRPDMEALAAATTQTLEAMKAAPNAAGQIAAYDAYEKKMQTAGTMQQIAYIRHTINTKDEFYNAENDYMDEIGPKLQELTHRVNTALLESPYREELEKHYGALMFKNLEIAARSFSPAIVELMQEENKLVSEYQNLYASATVEFDGKIMPLPLLGPYKQDPDRAVRKAAYEADAKFFDSHREELDTLYDKLVKVRDAQAKKMGLPNYIPLGYDRMGRNCYTAKDVAAFRDQIAEDMVPIVAKVKPSAAVLVWKSWRFTMSRLALRMATPYQRVPRMKFWRPARRCTRNFLPKRRSSLTLCLRTSCLMCFPAMARPLAATAPRSPIINPRSSSATLMLPPVMWMY